LTAILIALPISYLLVASWLSSFAFRIDLNWSYFIGAGMLALVVAWITVSSQAFMASRISAVDSLRSE
jgi:ABC-type antimicrobial peptide transport system permease subunit